MDSQHMRMLKNDLEIAITNLVRDFEIQTGLQVEGINLRKNRSMNKQSETYKTDIISIFK